jgi:cytochrome oxidase assembly protein ShyY1
MRRLTFLLRPGWVALAVVVIAFTYLCFSVLAPWQLGKNTRTSRENNQIQQSLTTAPVPLKTLLPQQDSSAPDAQWRRVTATGHYFPDKQLLARLRVAGGGPALEVLVPFIVDGGPNVLVDRGYVRPEQGSRVPPIPPPPHELVTITARLRDSEQPVLDKESFTSDGVRQVYSIDVSQIATLTGVPLAGSYLQLVDNQPGGLGVIGVPHLDAGPFLSYGIQWITFGVIAPILLCYFVYAEIRTRRTEKRPTSATEPTEKPVPATVEDKLTDRYGRRR